MNRMEGLHGKHCDKYVVVEGKICDRPATVCNLGRYRCNEHDPLRIPFVGEYSDKASAEEPKQ